jgi:hypothetical protein
MSQEFPKMIYHIVLKDQKIINNKDEEQFWCRQGWTTVYNPIDSKEVIAKKITYHLDEVDRLKKLLQNYDYEVKIDENEAVPVVVETPEAEFIENEPEATEETKKKGRGRPKKEG